MKKLKFIFTIFFTCALFALLLSGCAGGTRAKPSNKQILEDLSKSFSEKNSSESQKMDIESFDVELSQSEDKTYVANLKVMAKSKSDYAEIYWKVDVEYFKYDQGWKIEKCDWDYSPSNIEVVKYPNKTELAKIITEILDTDITVEKFNISKEDSTIDCQVRSTVDWCEYASGKLTTHLTLKYSEYDDAWIDSNNINRMLGTERLKDLFYEKSDGYSDEYDEFVLKQSLAGKYDLKKKMTIGGGESAFGHQIINIESTYETNGTIIISNVTDHGFDLRCDAMQTDTHFTIKHVRTYKNFIHLILQDDTNSAKLILNLHEERFPYGTFEVAFDRDTSSYKDRLGYANNY